MKRSTLIAACLCICSASVTYLVSRAGPLDPPSGAVAPSYKTLSEVEPRIPISLTNTPGDSNSLFRITQPGSYYLTGNVTGVSGKSGIEIASSFVTIDLNGYTLTGVSGSLGGIVRDTQGRAGIMLRNGSVVGWGGDGVDLSFVSSLEGGGGRIDSVNSRANTGNGFKVADGSSVTNCHAGQNGGAGFLSANHVTFTHCVATGNVDSGFRNGFGMTLIGCEARANKRHGFEADGSSTFLGCAGSNNDLTGFVGSRCTFSKCNASFNQEGFSVFNSLVESCGAFSNPVAGISLSASNVAISNSVTNSTSGIRVTNTDNRIEGNNVSSSTTCFDVTGTGNLIIRNSASGGTRYSIAGGNSVGPIVTSAGMASLTNPSANFDY